LVEKERLFEGCQRFGEERRSREEDARFDLVFGCRSSGCYGRNILDVRILGGALARFESCRGGGIAALLDERGGFADVVDAVGAYSRMSG
jgi:hypothetical protein